MQENLEKVCQSFILGDLKAFEKIEEGVLNVNFKIDTEKGKFFIKTVRDKKQDQIDTIYQTEKYMQDNNIPAISMLLNQNNEKFLKLENSAFCVYPFVKSDRSHTYSENDYFNMGEMLAEIHLLSKEKLPSFEIGVRKNKSKEEALLKLKSSKEKIESKKVLNEIDEKFLNNINLKIETLNVMIESKAIYSHQNHLLHGDYQEGNLLIDKDSREIIGICDWEKSEIGSRAGEVARSIICILDLRKEENFKYIKDFLDGYNSKYPLSEDELLEGFEYRLEVTVKSNWIANMYYDNNDSRANHFVDYENFLVEFYKKDWKDKIITNIK